MRVSCLEPAYKPPGLKTRVGGPPALDQPPFYNPNLTLFYDQSYCFFLRAGRLALAGAAAVSLTTSVPSWVKLAPAGTR